jgi:phosphoglycolate phosphatase-like HAD superfamily hydrolase
MFIPQVLIYDFDGVISDSVSIKTDAFLELYKHCESSIQTQVKEYHLANGGISRIEKFKYFQSNILGKVISESEIFELSSKFSFIVKNKVIESQYIRGAYEFIRRNSFRDQFICSGTPEEEILDICDKKGISSFFKNQYGSPKSKLEIIDIILSHTGRKTSECVFFGDSMTDYYAAKSRDIPFIGIRNSLTTFPQGTIVIDNFEELNF